MDIKTVTLSKSDIFYRGKLPGSLVLLKDNKSQGASFFVKIIGVLNDEERYRQLDIPQIYEIANSYVRAWDSLTNTGVEYGFSRSLADPDQKITVKVPERLYWEPYPTTLRCKTCGALDNFKSKEESQRLDNLRNLTRVRGKQRCKRQGCNGFMSQVPFVAVHRCGVMRELQHQGRMMRVKNLGFEWSGDSMFGAKYFDVDNRSYTDTALQSTCSCRQGQPSADGANLVGTPANGNVLWPHNALFLALNKKIADVIKKTGAILESTDAAHRDLKGKLVNLLIRCLVGEEEGKALVDFVNKEEEESSESASQTIEEMGKDLEKHKGDLELIRANLRGTPALESAETIFLEKIEKLEASLDEAKRLTVTSGVFHHSEFSELLPIVRTRRALESILLPLVADKSRETLTDLKKRSFASQKARLQQDSNYLKKYGVDEITHYSAIDVVLASIGFTRELLKPSDNSSATGSTVPVQLVGYRETTKRASGEQPKHSIYALPAETEAIEIKLDASKVLMWCVHRAGWDDPGEEILSSDVLSLQYLLKNCQALRSDPVNVFREANKTDLVNLAPFNLLHTISHCLIANIERHSGYEGKEISEYLLPMRLSILLYVTSVRNYNSGGLRLLFENYLSRWLDDASNFALNCLFDPICADRGNTCSGCVQQVIGCETFNQGLSRAYLHGGGVKFDDQSEIEQQITGGFWS